MPGCVKPEALYCCNQVFQFDTGVSNNPTQPNPFFQPLTLRTILNILSRNNKYIELEGREQPERDQSFVKIHIY